MTKYFSVLMKTQPNVTFGENKPTTGTENYPEPTCMLWVTTKGEKKTKTNKQHFLPSFKSHYTAEATSQ